MNRRRSPQEPVDGTAAWANLLGTAAWANLLARFPIDWRAVTQICRSNATAERCYGEPTAKGLATLIGRWPAECELDGASSLIDVGAGFGRLAAYVRLHTIVRRVVGVEINRCRYNGARALHAHMNGTEASTSLDFVLGDVRTTGLGSATHAFCSTQCWGEALVEAILVQALSGSFAASGRCLIFAEDFAFRPHGHAKWTSNVLARADAWGRVVAVEPIDTTWSGVSAIFLRRGAACDGHKAVNGMKANNSCMTMREGIQEAERQSTVQNRWLRARGEAEHRLALKALRALTTNTKCEAARCHGRCSPSARSDSGSLYDGVDGLPAGVQLPTPTTEYAGALLERWRARTCQSCCTRGRSQK